MTRVVKRLAPILDLNKYVYLFPEFVPESKNFVEDLLDWGTLPSSMLPGY
jgi:hypothetical protein